MFPANDVPCSKSGWNSNAHPFISRGCPSLEIPTTLPRRHKYKRSFLIIVRVPAVFQVAALHFFQKDEYP